MLPYKLMELRVEALELAVAKLEESFKTWQYIYADHVYDGHRPVKRTDPDGIVWYGTGQKGG